MQEVGTDISCDGCEVVNVNGKYGTCLEALTNMYISHLSIMEAKLREDLKLQMQLQLVGQLLYEIYS